MKKSAFIYRVETVDHREISEKFSDGNRVIKLFRKDGHCTKEGYRVVAENIFKKLTKEGLIEEE